MTTDSRTRWQRVKTLFQEAAQRTSRERAVFLSSACGGDPSLQAEVEQLIAAHEDDRPFLDAPVVPGAARLLAECLADQAPPPPALVPGTRVGQYEILNPLGTGGMGDVYRALDNRLDRLVALKLIRNSAMQGDPSSQVLKEARAACALNHPHICTVYEIGELEGIPYLAMEYIDGQVLRDLIPPDGLPSREVVRYGEQIADALAHAHEHRVIHCDFKTANVVVTPDGRAKVLDFGIAQREPRLDPDVERPIAASPDVAVLAGTPAYMAPELFLGQPADERSDIWALGVVLHEMATGRRPSADGAEVASSSTPGDVPSPPLRLRPGIRAVVERCLQKDPERRYQRASDVRAALDACVQEDRTPRSRIFPRLVIGWVSVVVIVLAVALVVWRPRSTGNASASTAIAVLPFHVTSGVQTIGFLGVGLPDSIISRVAVLAQARILPTAATLAYERGDVDPRVAGRALGVTHVVTGSIESTGAEVRVRPQLVRVADGVSIWAQPFARPSSDLLSLHEEIAAGIVKALRLQTRDGGPLRVPRRYTSDPDAHALYLQGRTQLVRGGKDSTLASVTSFQAALARDPEYTLPYAGLAMASAQMRLFFAPEADVAAWEARAHQAAQQAVRRDSDLAEAHEALAAVYRSAEFDWHQAIEESSRALALNPNLDQPHLYRASAFSHLGLFERVDAEAGAAMTINPANIAEPLRVRGVTALFQGRYDEAVGLLERARRAAGKLTADWNLANAYYYAGRRAEAEAMLQDLQGSARSERRAQATLASFLAARGEQDRARELIRRAASATYLDHHVAYALGAAYAQLRMPSDALRWLIQARATGYPCLPWYERDPLLAPLRGDTAFRQFEQELKRSWETARARHGVDK